MTAEMTFTIVAELPLGTYRGAHADGRVERIPSVARLYSALLCAAGFGPRAVVEGQSSAPCPADEEALRWIEQTPPDRVSVPALEVNAGRVTAYRDDGTIKNNKTSMGIKKLPKAPDVSVAVDGSFAWTWTTPPPEPVAAALSALCPDVPYLGTTQSPVRLRVLDAGSPTDGSRLAGSAMVLDPEAGIFSPGGEDVALPLPGRLEELRAAHRSATSASPTVAKDRWTGNEISAAPAPPDSSVALARYRPAAPPVADGPWPTVIMLPLDRYVPERDRVRMAVATHRALVQALGYGAPTLITGAYEPGAQRPANRLALHFVDDSMPVDLRSHHHALALLLPPDVPASELDAVKQAVGSLDSVRAGRVGVVRVRDDQWAVSGDRFWGPCPPGMVRTWRTSPPTVPDIRGVGGRPWTFGHAALLSLGFVWKARWPRLAGRGDERYVRLVDLVGEAGAAAITATPIRETDIRPYVHTMNPGTVARPYRTRLWLGDLGTAQTVLAIGQTRHLGGGLLIPVDAPEKGDEG